MMLTRALYYIRSVHTSMKRVEIIIPHRMLEDAHEIIKDVNTGGMSYYTVEGSGRIKAQRITVGRGTFQTQPQYIPRTKIEVVVKDDQVEVLISKITEKLGSELGGKIFVIDVPVAVDMRTRKRGDEAI
jgi:nitrogen regulatory protein P-II 1